MELVKSRNEVLKNLYTIYCYLNSESDLEKSFAKNLLAKGRVFVVERILDEYIFSPSRFAGYIDNSQKEHIENKDKDGRETNSALQLIYGNEQANTSVFEEFKSKLKSLGIAKNFDTEITIRFYFDEQSIQHDPEIYFISPTHMAGKKEHAWNSFKRNEIAAIGWEHIDFSGLPWKDVEEEIREWGYDNEAPAVESFRYLLRIQTGDIIVATNAGHGIFGIGVAVSSYKFKQGIHDCGNTLEEGGGYSHYVSVAWLSTTYISKSKLTKKDNESWWQPYGTISEKRIIPSYISGRLLGKPEEMINENFINENSRHMHLNTILYGPPGTGKTYNTINKALAIVGFDVNKRERSTLKEEFEKRLEVGQIVFTTFHQSLSYEDFVEGIKPLKPEKDKPIQYDVKDGIFKALANRAFHNLVRQKKAENSYINPSFDKLHEDFIEHIRPFIEKDTNLFPTLYNHEIKLIQIKGSSIIVMFRFQDSAKTIPATQPFSIAKEKLKLLFEAGIVPSTVKSLKASLSQFIRHNLSVYYAVYKKFYEYVQSQVKNTPMPEIELDGYLSYEDLKEEWLLMDAESRKNNIENADEHIIIIDEINRGNVSQIFGELITLIEEDKRLGKSEFLEVTLPYSNTRFAVPCNLYIIGTMNTADRSVEAIDVALRRRFSFEFIPPLPAILTDTVGGVDLKHLLTTLNERVGYLKDQDHQIGHSYFIGVTNEAQLKEVFKYKIIPLLKEYFYNDFGKIRLVLGDSFIKKNINVPTFAVADHDEIQKETYNFLDIDENFLIIEALKQLLGK